MRVFLALATLASAIGLDALAAQTPSPGQRQFIQCRACHALGPSPAMRAGPHLNGIVGRKAGAVQGYAYSPALKTSGLTWTRATLDAFLKRPHTVIPGTKMAFAGMADAARRAQLIDYLQTQNGSERKGRR